VRHPFHRESVDGSNNYIAEMMVFPAWSQCFDFNVLTLLFGCHERYLSHTESCEKVMIYVLWDLAQPEVLRTLSLKIDLCQVLLI